MTSTYHRTGTEALAELKHRTEGVALAWVGYRAGRNHYNLHNDLEEAVIYGAHALRRWWVWLGFVNLTLIFVLATAWMEYLRHHDIRGESFPESATFKNTLLQFQIVIPIMVLLLAILYCRNVDYSLFKRRFVYKVLSPLVRLLDRIPNGALYLLIPLLAVLPIRLIGIGTTDTEIHTDAVTTLCETMDDGGHQATATMLQEAGVPLPLDGDTIDLTTWRAANCVVEEVGAPSADAYID